MCLVLRANSAVPGRIEDHKRYNVRHFGKLTEQLTMRCLLVVAHGSRRDESNLEILRLTEKVAALSDGRFDRVECAYLELADPLIPDAIGALAAAGATSVLVVPYFLARGAHVASDVPEQVGIAQAANPSVAISISDYLGASDEMPSLIMQLAANVKAAG